MTYADAVALLKLSGEVTPEKLRAAYRRAAFHAHPDRGGSTEALKRINAAYEFLGGKDGGGGFTVDVDHQGSARKRQAGKPAPRERAEQAKVLYICRSCSTVFVGGGLATHACTQVLPDNSVCGGTIRRYDEPDPDPEATARRIARGPVGKSPRYL